jgi:mRNA-degrading endonuclease RelE of RelBE toxin-antitoxin system
LSQDRIDKLNELGFEIIVENNLANEEHIAKKSKTHHNKIDLREQKMNEKCKRLAKQIVDIAGEKASELLEVSITERRLKLLLGERFSELEKLPSHPNLYRLRAPIEWEVDLLDCERVK